MQTVKHNLQHCILYITPTYRYEYSAVAIYFVHSYRVSDVTESFSLSDKRFSNVASDTLRILAACHRQHQLCNEPYNSATRWFTSVRSRLVGIVPVTSQLKIGHMRLFFA